jgi:hypothetical protein
VTSRCGRASVLAVAIIALLPRTAHAGLLSWLDQLSGPGGFITFEASRGIWCSKPPVDRPENHTLAGFGIRAGCQSKVSLDERNLTLFAAAGGGIAVKNDLDYHGAPGSKAVRFLRAGTSLDYTLHRTLDVGVGAGVMYFVGPSFANFARIYVEPVRVGFRPLVIRKTPRMERLGAVVVYVNWHILTGTVEGKTFGAPLDPFHARNELDRKEYGLTIDVGRLLYWKN